MALCRACPLSRASLWCQRTSSSPPHSHTPQVMLPVRHPRPPHLTMTLLLSHSAPTAITGELLPCQVRVSAHCFVCLWFILYCQCLYEGIWKPSSSHTLLPFLHSSGVYNFSKFLYLIFVEHSCLIPFLHFKFNCESNDLGSG